MSGATVASAKEQFDQQAGNYNEKWASWSDETLRRMLELADPRAEWRVLDVATGTGFTALAFAPHVAHVTGADLSPGMLAEAAKRAQAQNIANVDWAECAAESLPFSDAAFDLVTVRIAPHHFSDLGAFLRETARVLAPGGVFVLGDTTVPDADDTAPDAAEAAAWQNAVERERDPSHVANRMPGEWRTLCAAAGLTVTDVEHKRGAIAIPLDDWLTTAGATGERAARVRRMFADAPASAVREFDLRTDESGATRFAWHRVILRAVKEPNT